MAVRKWLRATARRCYHGPYSIDAFMRSLSASPSVLDVGCGNDSPLRIKMKRPDCRYVGLDVCDYNQSAESMCKADEYIILPDTDAFNAAIRTRAGQFDAVISNHNIEHCDDPMTTLRAMVGALRPDGRLYMAFPCAESVKFPSRRGTLNFFDDPTHKEVPDFNAIGLFIAKAGLRLVGSARRYRPVGEVLLGAKNELESARTKTVMPGTWALYGFESVIWAQRTS